MTSSLINSFYRREVGAVKNPDSVKVKSVSSVKDGSGVNVFFEMDLPDANLKTISMVNILGMTSS